MLATVVQLPPVATAVPTTVAPSKSVTVVPLSAVPVKVGAVTLVMLSVFDMPLSLAAVRSGTDGAAGAVESIVTLNAAEGALTLPTASMACAIRL